MPLVSVVLVTPEHQYTQATTGYSAGIQCRWVRYRHDDGETNEHVSPHCSEATEILDRDHPCFSVSRAFALLREVFPVPRLGAVFDSSCDRGSPVGCGLCGGVRRGRSQIALVPHP